MAASGRGAVSKATRRAHPIPQSDEDSGVDEELGGLAGMLHRRTGGYFTPEVYAAFMYALAVLATVIAVVVSYLFIAHSQRVDQWLQHIASMQAASRPDLGAGLVGSGNSTTFAGLTLQDQLKEAQTQISTMTTAHQAEVARLQAQLTAAQQATANTNSSTVGQGGRGGGYLPGPVGEAQPLSVPSNFQKYDVNTRLPPEYLPDVLLRKYDGAAVGEDTLAFHWVITSCNRHHWGRMLTSTLLSGLANDLKPTTITILWCKPYNASSIPGLLYNLRHGHNINVMFMSPALEAVEGIQHMVKVVTTFLSVPEVLGAPHLPLLMSEDDVLFAPDANARLRNALNKMTDSARNEPFLISLYVPGDIKPAPEDPSHIQQPADDAGQPGPSHSASVHQLQRVYWFGTQGFYFSAPMTALLVREMLKMVRKESEGHIGLQDTLLLGIFDKMWHCNRPGSNCHYYRLHPSLVQHVGTSSALFNDAGSQLNTRFHHALDFPVRVTFPGYEPSDKWRRSARKLRALPRVG